MNPHHFVIVFDRAAKHYRFFQVYATSLGIIREKVLEVYREHGWDPEGVGRINSFPLLDWQPTRYLGAFSLSPQWYKSLIPGMEDYHLESLTFEAVLKSDGSLFLSGAALREGFAAGEVRALRHFLDGVPLPDDFENFMPVREDHDEQGPDME